VLAASIIRAMSHLVGKPEGKKALGKSNRMGEDNIKMDLKEIKVYVEFRFHKRRRICCLVDRQVDVVITNK
jgi:hypothetical protein